MIPDNYNADRVAPIDAVVVVCHNCGRKRRAVRAVARLLPRDSEGMAFTEVCHECLNQERVGRGAIRYRTS